MECEHTQERWESDAEIHSSSDVLKDRIMELSDAHILYGNDRLPALSNGDPGHGLSGAEWIE